MQRRHDTATRQAISPDTFIRFRRQKTTKVSHQHQAGQKCQYSRDIRPEIEAETNKTRIIGPEKHRKTRSFPLAAMGRTQQLKNHVKNEALGHQNPPLGDPGASKGLKNTSFLQYEITKNHVFLGLKWLHATHFEAANGSKRLQAEKRTENAETFANSKGLKERKSKFINPLRPHLARKKRAF